MTGRLIGGVVGGAVGAAIWALVAYYVNFESGWIAIGIGALVGVGVRMGAAEEGGAPAGMLAAILAIVSILAGKWFAMQAAIDTHMSDDQLAMAAIADGLASDQGRFPNFSDDAESFEDVYGTVVWAGAEARWEAMTDQERENIRVQPALAYENYPVSWLADEVVQARMDAGETVNWPRGMTFDMAWYEADYPREVWAEATDQWNEMNSSEQATYRDQVRDSLLYQASQSSLSSSDLRDEVAGEAFFESFHPMDILFGVLAIAAAFSVGSGRGGG